MSEISKCPIWGTECANENIVKTWENAFVTYVQDSPRAGGAYRINPRETVEAALQQLNDSEKARLTTWLIDQRGQTGPPLDIDHWPEVTVSIISYIKNRRPLQVHERADRLLRFIARRPGTVGTRICVKKDHENEALAWSESVNWEEVDYLLNYLVENRLLAALKITRGLAHTVTVSGHGRIADQSSSVVSSQVFVAMWFDESMNEAYEKGIKRAIEAAGFDALRIDQKEDANKIDDDIIAGIRQSRFLVADFTQGEDGARGSVYYEAGFAQGLGIPVIYMCRKGTVDKLHFDTRQYAHIVWETAEELYNGLLKRIQARIGAVRGESADSG